ncbi:hypothetical protein THRCLA_07292 [Thraustotheca clavata]|uniref:RING-type domain-containing protein n=1 Tax=Thraustotheca clavata TaxID=74557 RepID=A0A1V9ZEL4_9STRA|nr:hypothetical protein THRCLA_07292 [Thraustotheca clavata]
MTLVSIRSSAKQNLSKACGHLVTYYSLTVICPTSRIWWSMKRRYSDMYFVRQRLYQMYKNALRLRQTRSVERIIAMLAPIFETKFPPKRYCLDTKAIIQERLVGLKEFVAQLVQLRRACLEPFEITLQSFFETEQISEIFRLVGHALAVPARTKSPCAPSICNDSEPCAICLEDQSSSKDYTFELPCGHHFHQNCILEWFDTQHTCPMCRMEASSGRVV